ncbi:MULTISPECIES: HipA family kinase [Brevibacillus]|jgi:hypothetical protein|uniref:PI3K/PI4K catalytic domain-containing protein n=1 Tax=Brevibacillus parabrevis TaxID=54914 RepID=A0A4Y3PFS3_BREPA|nr:MULTISPECIES: HipA family kinase [Brevibacillus]MBU8715899.1 hypothetical protein [Brevibacillus parabrevis]MDH6352498.1 hypothetical protein [Brevibacillus sp. 1238]MDR4998041.1 hypothetical protein [Brevibacillus parabrevis]NRQ55987.1 hypothetical protein [Brevibacillus sp. HD1.4A]RNB95857.1 hypothetical protein EDM60_09150 [Brevibacillus parabrevis]
MSTNKWRTHRRFSRRFGTVWSVWRSVNGKIQRGYFKFPCKKNAKWGNVIANELIAYHLAKLLELNVATVELTVVEGKQGIVSIAKPMAAHFNWFQLTKKTGGSPVKHLHNPEQLLLTFVFDIWICNIDRHGGNLIVFPKGKHYDFYLIDHGSAVLGGVTWRKIHWSADYWLNVSKYNFHYPRGLRAYIRTFRQLLPHVDKIEKIPEHMIRDIVETVPENVLPKLEKEMVVEMLLYRQKKLREMVVAWCMRHKKAIAE